MVWWTTDKTALLPKLLKNWSVIDDLFRHLSQTEVWKKKKKPFFSQSPKRLGHAALNFLFMMSWKARKYQTDVSFVPACTSSEVTIKRQQKFNCRNDKRLLDETEYHLFVFANKTTEPRPFSVNCPEYYAVELTSFFTYRKLFPKLVNSGWLLWIIHGILANQKRRNILNE